MWLAEMERWCGRVALVTGASVGIGAAICRQLVAHGMKVVGAARNVDQIKVLTGSHGPSSSFILVIKSLFPLLFIASLDACWCYFYLVLLAPPLPRDTCSLLHQQC